MDDKQTDYDVALRNPNAFTQNLTNCLRINENSVEGPLDCAWIEDKAHLTDLDIDIYSLHAPAQELNNHEEYMINLKEYLHPNSNIFSGEIIKHAEERDIVDLEGFQFVEPISTQELLAKEILDDVLQRALNFWHCERNMKKEQFRSSSLKSGNCAGAQGIKKVVRFADVLGLDLTDVRTYLDEVPNIPQSAFDDLNFNEGSLLRNMPKTLVPLFEPPNLEKDVFIQKVIVQMVALESTELDDNVPFCLRGCARVRNLEYIKNVYVRFTLDSWEHSADVQCSYVDGSSDGFTDKFDFVLYAYELDVGQQLEFAIKFECCGEEFWDNNNGENFCFRCLPTSAFDTIPDTDNVEDSISSFLHIRRDSCDLLAIGKTAQDECIGEGKQLSSFQVQEYIARSLNKNEKRMMHCETNTKQEVAIVCIVIVLAIVAWYLRKIIM